MGPGITGGLDLVGWVPVVPGAVPLGAGLRGWSLGRQWSAGPGTLWVVVVVVVVVVWSVAPCEPHATAAEPMATVTVRPNTADHRRGRSHAVSCGYGSSAWAAVLAMSRGCFRKDGVFRNRTSAPPRGGWTRLWCVGRGHAWPGWLSVWFSTVNVFLGDVDNPTKARPRRRGQRFSLNQIDTCRSRKSARVRGAQPVIGPKNGLKGENPRVCRFQ